MSGSQLSEHTKKAAAFHNEAALSKIFVYDSTFNYALPETTKPADAYTYNYKEHQGYTDVQGYAVEPRDVTFGWETHRYNLIFVNGVGGHFCTFFPKFFPMLNIDGIRLQAHYDAIVDIDAVTHKAVTDNNAVVARNADERCSTTARCKRK